MSDWVAPLRSALATEGRAVLVTIAAARGSTPREVGAKMIVTTSLTHGTIGGGHLEFEAIRIAREALAGAVTGAWLARFPLAARLGQCCGGVATLLFQGLDEHALHWLDELARHGEDDAPLALVSPIDRDAFTPVPVSASGLAQTGWPPEVVATVEQALLHPDVPPQLTVNGAWFIERVSSSDFRVVVFGNGHVGRALVQVLGTLPCSVTWVDQREEDFPLNVPSNIAVVATDAPEDEVRHAAVGSLFLVMTHSHGLDLELAHAILKRGDFSYFGLIGSASKRAQFERRLVALGVPRALLPRMTCPIGVAGIRNKTPGAIAVAVAAQLLELRERDTTAAVRRAAR
jgi:xanthine dehydrogenase accessory factor